jgi:phasin
MSSSIQTHVGQRAHPSRIRPRCRRPLQKEATMQASLGAFEIPNEMRAMAEQSVVQARQAFDTFMGAAHQAATKFEQQTVAAQGAANSAGKKLMAYAERNVAASFDFAQRLARAKDLQDMAEIQQEFAKAQMQTLSEQAKELEQGGAQGRERRSR